MFPRLHPMKIFPRANLSPLGDVLNSRNRERPVGHLVIRHYVKPVDQHRIEPNNAQLP